MLNGHPAEPPSWHFNTRARDPVCFVTQALAALCPFCRREERSHAPNAWPCLWFLLLIKFTTDLYAPQPIDLDVLQVLYSGQSWGICPINLKYCTSIASHVLFIRFFFTAWSAFHGCCLACISASPNKLILEVQTLIIPLLMYSYYDRHVYKRSAQDECLQLSAINAVHKTVDGKTLPLYLRGKNWNRVRDQPIAGGQHTPVEVVDVILSCQQHHYDSLPRVEFNPKSCALINTL